MSIKTWTEWGASRPHLAGRDGGAQDVNGGLTLSRHWEDGRLPLTVMRIHSFSERAAPADDDTQSFQILSRTGINNFHTVGEYNTFEEALAVAKVWYAANKSTCYGYPVELNNTICLEFSHD